MPLCTLEIPRERWAALAPWEKKSALGLLGNALDLTRDGLEIPDAQDREVRVLVRDGATSAKISISFTVGPNEYPAFPGKEAFFPVADKVRAVGSAVQAVTGRELGVEETRMEAWRDTTFLPVNRSAEEAELVPPPKLENPDEIGGNLDQPKLTLVVCEEKLAAASPPEKEGPPASEAEPYSPVLAEMKQLVKEALGLPERTVTAEILAAAYADTDFSLEFDCQPQESYLIPEQVRTYLAKRLEACLNQHPLTNQGSAEIWIRQGQPETYVATLSSPISV